jgi:hypothetical protein
VGEKMSVLNTSLIYFLQALDMTHMCSTITFSSSAATAKLTLFDKVFIKI